MRTEPPGSAGSQEPTSLWTRITLAAAGLCYVGLNFEAWGWPAIDGYPTIERFLDPTYLSTDFYTNTSRGYGVDTAQAYLFGGIERLLGVRYDVTLALVNLVRCLTFPALVYWFFLTLSGKRSVALSGALLGVISNFALPKTLGWAWVWGDPSTAMFAIPAIVIGWTFLLQRKAWACFIAFGFAAAMHPLASLHGALVIGTILLLDYTRAELVRLLRSPASLSSAAVFGAVFLAQLVALQADAKDALPIAEYVNVMAHERHPGDYLPSRFPADTVAAFVSGALAVALVVWRMWDAIPRRRFVLGTLALYFAVCVSGWLFVEVWPSRFFVQLIPFRTANIGAPLMLLLLSLFAARLLEDRKYASYALVALFFLAASPYAARLAGSSGTLVKVGAPALLAVFTFLTLVGRVRLPPALEAALRPVFSGPRFIFVAVALVVLGAASARGRRDAFVIPRVDNQHPVYAWMRAHTDPAATFLVDQFSSHGRFSRAVNPQKVRLVGRRAVVASLDFPFLDRDMRSWLERWKLVLAGRSPDRVENADAETLARIHERFPFDFVLRRTPAPASAKLSLAARFDREHQVDHVFVYRMPATAPARAPAAPHH